MNKRNCRQLGYREMVMASLRVNSSEPLDKVKDKIEGMEIVKYSEVSLKIRQFDS